jgi:hypothetical protein
MGGGGVNSVDFLYKYLCLVIPATRYMQYSIFCLDNQLISNPHNRNVTEGVGKSQGIIESLVFIKDSNKLTNTLVLCLFYSMLPPYTALCLDSVTSPVILTLVKIIAQIFLIQLPCRVDRLLGKQKGKETTFFLVAGFGSTPPPTPC